MMKNNEPFFTSEEKDEMFNKILERTGKSNNSYDELNVRFKRYKRVSLVSYACILVLCILITIILMGIINKNLYEMNNSLLTEDEIEYIESFGGEYDGEIYAELTGFNNYKIYVIRTFSNEKWQYFIKHSKNQVIHVNAIIDDKIIELNEELEKIYSSSKESIYSKELTVIITDENNQKLEYKLYL